MDNLMTCQHVIKLFVTLDCQYDHRSYHIITAKNDSEFTGARSHFELVMQY